MRIANYQPTSKSAISHPFKPGQPLDKLDDMLAKGEIASYVQEDGQIKVETTPGTDVAKLDGALTQPARLPLLAKASQLFVPADLKDNCAPEYLKFRMWQLGGAVCGGALGFITAQVSLAALNTSFSSTETAVLAGSIIGTTGTVASMAASFLAKKGDSDPKRSYMNSAMMATAGSLATVAGLWLLPKQYVPFTLGTTLLGAVAGGLGGSAGLNISNHMAKEQARGTVGAKNANQDRVAGFIGVPLALGLTHAATAVGLNPTMACIGVLGAGLFLCNLQSAISLRFESVDRKKLESLVGNLLDGKAPEKAGGGQLKALKSLFFPKKNEAGALTYLDTPTPLAQPERLHTLAKEDYLVGLDEHGKGQITFRKNVGADGLIQGVAHALLLERCEPLRQAAQEVAPGKAELLLTELSYRALPRGGNWKEQLSHTGWHVHAEKLKVGSDQRWRGNGDKFSPLPLQDLSKLLEAPSADGLRQLLKDSPLLQNP